MAECEREDIKDCPYRTTETTITMSPPATKGPEYQACHSIPCLKAIEDKLDQIILEWGNDKPILKDVF